MGTRVRVRKGYTFLGRGNVGHKEGTVFENIDPKEIADQRWKFEDLPSRKSDEAEGIVIPGGESNPKTTEVLSNADRAAKEAEEAEAAQELADKEAKEAEEAEEAAKVAEKEAEEAEELAAKEEEEAKEAQDLADKEAEEAEAAAKVVEEEAPKEEKKGRAKRKKN